MGLEVESIYKHSLQYLIIIALILTVVFWGNYSISLGLLSGGIVSLLNYRINAYSIGRIFRRNSKSTFFFAGLYVIRLILIIIVITYSYYYQSLNLFSAVVGLLWVRIVITVEAIIHQLRKTK